ncbi:MAG TPA: hypothetical protein VNK91_03060 [Burkholderiaceae bacterium]|nr:hypothetical protein [Burkholderiaceae bacterium]
MNFADPIRVDARAKGGCDVDLKFALYAGKTSGNADDIELAVDAHLQPWQGTLEASGRKTPVAVVILASVVPLKSDAYAIEIVLSHPDLAQPRTIDWSGRTGGLPKTLKRTVWLEQP